MKLDRRLIALFFALVVVIAGSVSACAELLGLDAYHDGVCEPGTKAECPYSGPDGTKGVGTCRAGTRICKDDGSGYGECDGEVTPRAEDCSTPEDENCDGHVNEGCCTPKATMACYSGAPGTASTGNCKGGTATCLEDGSGWGPCEGEVIPAKEDCTTKGDEDCDGNACSDAVWNVIGTGTGSEYITGLAVDSTGDVYLAASFNDIVTFGGTSIAVTPSDGTTDYYVAKFAHQDGTLLWLKQLGDSGYNAGVLRLAVDPSDNLIVAGALWGSFDFGAGAVTSAGSSDAFVAKYGKDGSLTWTARFGDAASQWVTALAVDSKGSIVLGGGFFGSLALAGQVLTNTATNSHGFLAKLTATGNAVFAVPFEDAPGDPKVGFFSLTGVAVDPSDDSVTVAGNFTDSISLGPKTFNSYGQHDIFLAKYDAQGSHVWSQQFGSTGQDYAAAVAISPSGHIALAGSYEGAINFGTGSLSSGAGTGFAAAFDATGVPLWSKGFFAIPSGVAVDSSGATFLAATTGVGTLDFGAGPLVTGGGADAVLAKFDAKGAVAWNKAFGDVKDQAASFVALDPKSGHVVLAGNAQGAINFGLDTLTGNGNAFVATFQP